MARTIGVVGLACKTEVGYDLSASIYRATVEVLKNKDVEVVDTGVIIDAEETSEKAIERLKKADPDVVTVCVMTWSEDNYILTLLRKLQKPLILHSFPGVETGSLCGVMQMTSVLTDIGYSEYKTVYEEPGSDASADQIIAACEALESVQQKGMPTETFNIGNIGGRVYGMTEIAFDEFSLFEKCGAVVIPISETELDETVSAVDYKELKEALPLVKKKGYVIESLPEEINESLKYYIALKKLIQKYRLVGLTVKCYMRYMGKVCLAFSLLSDEGYVCSCEGDVGNAVMMRILADATGQCINNTDILHPDVESNTILFAHCGSSGFSIASKPEDVHLTHVRLKESGVCSLFMPKPGIVTVADLVGHGNQLRMSVMVGEAIDGEMQFPGNQAKIHFRKPVLDICKSVMEYGCGHHWMIGYGNVADKLRDYCKTHGIIFQRIV